MVKRKSNSKKILLIITFVIIISLSSLIIMYGIKANESINVKDENTKETIALSNIVNEGDYVLQRINEKYKNSNIEVYYPVTKYDILNNEIKSIIDAKITKFKDSVKEDTVYSMFINFDMYKYNNYIGFVFHTLEDFAGAHPNTYIFTINYDISNNSIINIDSLVKLNNNILNLMSKYSYDNLSKNDKLKEINLPHMLINGTKPIKNNFENFVFTNEGITIFFERYQIAPYTYGEFFITIPYKELNLNIKE